MPDFDIGLATADDFASRRDEEFRVHTPAGEAMLTLSEIRQLGPAVRAGGAFSLIFVAQGTPALRQAIHRISHPALGTMDIFIVPIGRVDGGDGYEAVFA